jgi:hypothetical protein
MRDGRRYLDQADDAGSQGAGGGGAADLGGADASLPAGRDDGKPADMLDAIDSGLGYKAEGGDGEKGAAAPSAEEKSAAEKKTADEQAIKDRDAKAAAGDAAAIKAKTDAESLAKAEAAKPKDLDALALTDAEKKAWKKETAERFEQVRTIAKEERAARTAAEQQVAVLAQSRDAILGVLKETNTTDADLVALLEFNRLQKSADASSLEKALKVVDGIRTRIMKTLGKEGDGNDPLTEFPDLQQEVTDMKISKERALEIVATRKRDALAEAERQRSGQQQHTEQQIQKARETGVNQIETWSTQTAKTDLDFKAKEAILLPQIEGIIKHYPPHLWLQTIKNVYAAIVVQKTGGSTDRRRRQQPAPASEWSEAGRAGPDVDGRSHQPGTWVREGLKDRVASGTG